LKNSPESMGKSSRVRTPLHGSGNLPSVYIPQFQTKLREVQERGVDCAASHVIFLLCEDPRHENH
jgi:hypothetical protein